MPSRYFIAPNDAGFLLSNGLLPPPEGWEEVTAEEYEERSATQRQVAADRAAHWWEENKPTA